MAALGYRPEIDGLRAVAVLPILLFHLDVEGLAGGFVGVDVFFVISGYLITRIVRRDVADQRFSFTRFYGRRIRRLFPALLAAIAVEPYRLKRLQIFLDPWADPEGKGYHVIQSMAAIHGGGIGGRGLGNGIQKFGYLPEDTTDFIFSIITEEFGLLGTTLLVGLFITLLWAGWRIVTSQVRPERQLLALGIVAMISLQTLMNLLVVTGLAPTKGIALPLVSSGGTGWVMTAFMLGVLARLDPTAPAAAALPNEPIPEVVP